MNNDCINRVISNYKNLASVIFDHKIKYSDIENATIGELNLTKYSLEKKEQGYRVNFSLNENLSDFTEGNFFITLKNSSEYDTSKKFSLNNSKNFSESIEFNDVLENKIIINGTKKESKGTITFLFSQDLENFTISNLKGQSFKDMNFTEDFSKNTNDSNGYHYVYTVYTNESGFSNINFEICGGTYKTKPIKFVQNITDAEDDYFNLEFNIMLFLIFLILF